MPVYYGQVKGRKYAADQPVYVPVQKTKQCIKCHMILPLDQFDLCKHRKDNHENICKLCKQFTKKGKIG